ncbi:MAG TPA: gephyrin-like molybdotransferase Glp [Acidimicrobiales bacterium]|nr:gephyrin-like molybdotransferase Glp [Acidimicrobiales bacterium]
MISLGEARQFVLRGLDPLEPTQLRLENALGCVAAGVVTAREPSPRFANSAMDGFAVRSLDTEGGSVRLRVTDAIFAGDAARARVGEGEAVRIMTGAPVPEGADSVTMREEATVDADGSTVLIHRAARPGEFVRMVGEDVTVGQTLLEPGDQIGPALIGVLASQGVTSVLAHPRPRVGVLSTGNELSNDSGALAAGKIRDSNRPALIASLHQSGFAPVDLGIVGDTAEEITAAFRHGVHECDAIISTGGVSVGDADFVKSVLAELCGETASSMQVAIRPGKPFAFGVAPSGTPFFGLAGNPVSTLVGFELFVRPALRLLAGFKELDRLTINVVLDCPMPRRRDGKLHLVHVVARVHDDGRVHVEHVARQASHLLSAIAECNAVALVPDGDGLDVGGTVPAMVLDATQLNGA